MSFKPKKKWRLSKKGVSDLIANILILAITVTLFSSVLYYVTGMQGPQKQTFAEFTGDVIYGGSSLINVTMKGGQSLQNADTKIIVIINSKYYQHTLKEGGISNTWVLGQTWSYLNDTNYPIKPTDKVEVMIIDTLNNNIVWQSVLAAGGNIEPYPPIITERGVLGYPVYENRTFTFYCKIIDYNDNLDYSGVYVDLYKLGEGKKPLTYLSATGAFYSGDIVASLNWNGKEVFFNATDTTGLNTSVPYTMTVFELSTGGGSISGGSGAPPGLLYYSQFEGINTFKLAEWRTLNYSAKPTSQFAINEQGIVVVASKFLVNTATTNELNIIDPVTNLIVQMVSSPNYEFVRYDYSSGYYVYNAMLDIKNLTANKEYLLQVNLRDSWQPSNNVFFATLNFKVGTANLPKFETYLDSAYTKAVNSFNSTDTIYVKVTNINGGTFNNVGLVELCDFHYDMMIKRIPGSSSPNPVSAITQVGNVYKFSINLSLAAQYPWIPGESSYILRYDTFNSGSGSNAESYLLVKFVNITAPKFIMDLVIGYPTTATTGWAGGSLIAYYKNQNQWTDPDIIQAISNKHQTGFSGCTFVTLGSINNNGKNDIIAVLDSSMIVVYLNDGSWTMLDVAVTTKTITAIKAAPLGYSGCDDIIVGFIDGSWGIYWNDGLWSFQQISVDTPSKITSIESIDTKNTTGLYGTPRLMDVVIGYDSSKGIRIYSNPGGQNQVWTTPAFYTGGTSSIDSRQATLQTSTYGDVVHGDQFSTWTGLDYEQINEVTGGQQTFKSFSSNPTLSFPYTLGASGTLTTTGWNLAPVPSGFTTIFVITYTVEKQNAASTIYLNNVAIGTTSSGTAGKFTTTIALSITDNTALTNAQIKIVNSDGSKTITINDWHILVTYPAQKVMQFTWGFQNVKTNMANLFTVTANTSANVYDTFEFKYSIDGGITYSSFSTPIIISSGTRTTYSCSFPALTTAGTLGTVYIKIFNRNLLNPNTELIQVSHMMIDTTVITAGSIGKVVSIKGADMNNDGWEDIVLCDTGNVWVLRNSAGSGLFTNPGQVDRPLIGWTDTIISMGVGPAKGANYINDILIACRPAHANDYIDIIDQVTIGSYSSAPVATGISLSYATIAAMEVGDVNGNGYVDVVVVYTSSYEMDLYSNYGGSFTKWIIGYAPNYVNSMCLGKVQTN